MTIGIAPRPCASCPYRRDVPSGIWHPDEYAKLIAYDAPTPQQPSRLFLCHQTDAEDAGKRLCAGWVGCHGTELLALRLAAITGRLANPTAVFSFTSPVALFSSGAQAAAHGIRELEQPRTKAVRAAEKIIRRRNDLAL